MKNVGFLRKTQKWNEHIHACWRKDRVFLRMQHVRRRSSDVFLTVREVGDTNFLFWCSEFWLFPATWFVPEFFSRNNEKLNPCSVFVRFSWATRPPDPCNIIHQPNQSELTTFEKQPEGWKTANFWRNISGTNVPEYFWTFLTLFSRTKWVFPGITVCFPDRLVCSEESPELWISDFVF